MSNDNWLNGSTGMSIVNMDCSVGDDVVDLFENVRTLKSYRPGIGGILTL